MTYKFNGVSYNERDATWVPASGITVRFQAGGTEAVDNADFTPGAVHFDITDRFAEQIVPGSVNFIIGSRRYFDRAGSLYNALNLVTGEGTLAGTINYSSGEVVLSDWAPGATNAVVLDSLLTTTGDNTVSGAAFRVPVSPVRPGSLQILATKVLGGTVNVTANIDGTISGTGVRGEVDYETGVVGIEFGAMVLASTVTDEPWYDAANIIGGNIWAPAFVFAETIRFNAVAYSYLPLDADILGLDPVRLPQDGRVPIFRKGGFAVLGHTHTSSSMTVTNGQTVDLGRVRLSRVRVLNEAGALITTGYTADLEAGEVTFTSVGSYDQPITIENRIEDMVQVSDVQISGQLAFTRQITHEYPVGSQVSSALIANDLKARVSKLFDQATWDGVTWVDNVTGSAATATYNDTSYPAVVTNKGAITERWVLKFTSPTAFQVIGEHVGVIDTGATNIPCAPINHATGTPYFTISELGFGTGWSAGNVIRINTVGAMFPVWVVRTVQQGAESVADDAFTILVRGDVDAP